MGPRQLVPSLAVAAALLVAPIICAEIAAGHTTQGVGALSGRITNRVSGRAVPGVEVLLFTNAGPPRRAAIRSTKTGSNGEYVLSDLASGSYFVQTKTPGVSGLIDEAYPGVRCWLALCAPSTGTPVEVVATGTASRIDFALVPGATISGTVIDAGSREPVVKTSVVVRPRAGGPSGPSAHTLTDERGRYRTPGLVSGEYVVEAGPYESSRLIKLLFERIPCPYFGCELSQGTAVTATEPNDTPQIDFALPVGGSISGTITDRATGEPLSHVLVVADGGQWQARAVSDAAGHYTIARLVTGVYSVEARPSWEGLLGAPTSIGLKLEQMVSATYGSSERARGRATAASRIPVNAPAAVTGIDIALGYGGRITGTVTNAKTGAPLSGVLVLISGPDSGQATTDASGRYEHAGLPTGTYNVFVLLTDVLTGARLQPFLEQVYKGIPCAGRSCWETRGAPVSVRAPQTTANIDFALDPVRVSGGPKFGPPYVR